MWAKSQRALALAHIDMAMWARPKGSQPQDARIAKIIL